MGRLSLGSGSLRTLTPGKGVLGTTATVERAIAVKPTMAVYDLRHIPLHIRINKVSQIESKPGTSWSGAKAMREDDKNLPAEEQNPYAKGQARMVDCYKDGVEFVGRMYMKEACDKLEVPYGTLQYRVSHGGVCKQGYSFVHVPLDEIPRSFVARLRVAPTRTRYEVWQNGKQIVITDMPGASDIAGVSELTVGKHSSTGATTKRGFSFKKVI